MIDLFKAHPVAVGETYGQHLRFAARKGAAMIADGSACVVHGLFPFLFATTGRECMASGSSQISPARGHRNGAEASDLDWDDLDF